MSYGTGEVFAYKDVYLRRVIGNYDVSMHIPVNQAIIHCYNATVTSLYSTRLKMVNFRSSICCTSLTILDVALRQEKSKPYSVVIVHYDFLVQV